MRKKIILMILALSFFVGIVIVYFKNLGSSSKLAVHSVDNKGIYVDKEKLGLESASDEVGQFNKAVKVLNEGWESIGVGDSYKKTGQYKKAIEAYKRAYEVDPGNRIMTGKILIEAYEKESRYDEALIVVEDILKNQPLAEIGVKRFEVIRARLLAAKAQSQDNSHVLSDV